MEWKITCINCWYWQEQFTRHRKNFRLLDQPASSTSTGFCFLFFGCLFNWRLALNGWCDDAKKPRAMFDMVTLPCTGCTTVITFIIIFHQNIYLGKSFPLLSINIQYIISESVQINTKSILINITFLSRKFDSQQLQQEKCIRNAK